MADATDWIIRYLIEISEDIFLFFLYIMAVRVQKDIVLISRRIQITSQDEVIRHSTGVIVIPMITIGSVDILFNLFYIGKLQTYHLVTNFKACFTASHVLKTWSF